MVAMREFDTGIPVDEAVHNSLQLCARYLHVQVLRARRVGGEEGEVDLGVRGRRELALGFLRRLAKALDDERVLGHIDANTGGRNMGHRRERKGVKCPVRAVSYWSQGLKALPTESGYAPRWKEKRQLHGERLEAV
jgi:hypothetical protein